MRRFWAFPLFFAGLFLGFQLVWEWSSWLTSAISLSPMLGKTDIYFHIPRFDFRYYLPLTAIGMSVGLTFAALDFAFHPEDPRGDEAFRHLRKFWRLIVGALGIGLANDLVLQLGMSYWGSRRRYHAYSPDFEILNVLSLVTPMIWLIAMGWAIIKTLRRPRNTAN